MKYLLNLSFLLFVFSLQAQSFVDDHYQHLIDSDESTVINVSGDMFRYASIVMDDSDEEVDKHTKEVLAGIKSLQFVALDDLSNAHTKFLTGLKKMNRRNYAELINVKSKDGHVSVQIDEDGGVVHEIIAIGDDDENFFVGSILCEIKLEDLNEVIGKIQKSDWKAFDNFSDVKVEDLNIYPNPVSRSSDITIDFPEAMIGGKATLFDSNGKNVKNISIRSKAQQVSTEGLSSGNYILSVVHNTVTLKRKIIVLN